VSIILKVRDEARDINEEEQSGSSEQDCEMIENVVEQVKVLDNSIAELIAIGGGTYQNLMTLTSRVREFKSELFLYGETQNVASYNGVFLPQASQSYENIAKHLESILDDIEAENEEIKAKKAEIKERAENAFGIAQKIYQDSLFGERFSNSTAHLFAGLLQEDKRLENIWFFATDIKHHANELEEHRSAFSLRGQSRAIYDDMSAILDIVNAYMPK
jgi:hypothetical protein